MSEIAAPSKPATGLDPAGPRQVLEDALDRRQFPGCVAIFGSRSAQSEPIVLGRRTWDGPETTADTRYDLASLTKVMATLPAVLRLFQAERLWPDDRVKDWISNAGWFQLPSIRNVQVRELLTHTSGLPAWVPLYAQTSDRMTAMASLLQTPITEPPEGEPARIVYSDLGFMVLGALVERITQERLDHYVQHAVFGPLGMTETAFLPRDKAGHGPGLTTPIAPTEDCGWRNEVLCGVVHDENAFRLDGVAGHAGLFGPAADVARYARAWLELDPRLGGPADLRKACSEQASIVAERRGWGWLMKGSNLSFAGDGATETGFGHTGFTGTSLWVDPGAGWYAVLLTNRVHPSRTGGEDIHGVRRRFHAAVAAAVARG